jgi:hypothetical protein
LVCSTDPEFARKATDIVGPYLAPLVVSVDEKRAIQVLARAQSWLRLLNGRSIAEFQP